MQIQLMCVASARASILREWRSLGGKSSAFGSPTTEVLPHDDHQSYYQHFQGGTICWASPANVLPISRILVRYKDETRAMTTPQVKTFSASFVKMPKGKPKGPWRKLLESDPIGQDPGEEPNWVGTVSYTHLTLPTKRIV